MESCERNVMGQRILEDAHEEPPLWELPWRASETRRGETVQTRSELPIDVLLPCAVALVRAGEICVMALDRDGLEEPTVLELAEAISVVGDRRNWIPQAESNQSRAYAIGLPGPL